MTQKASMKGMWSRFIHMLVKSKLPYLWMAAAFLFNIAKSNIELIIPLNIAKVFGNELSVTLLLTIFGLGLLNAALTLASEVFKNIALQKIDRNMQRMSIQKLLWLKLKDIEKNDPREFVSRITTDTTLVSSLLLDLVISEIPRLYFMISSLIILFRDYNHRLALALLVTIPVTILGSWITGRLTFGKAEAVQGKIARLTARLAEKVNNVQIIKSYNNEDKETERGQEVIAELDKAKRGAAVMIRVKDFVNELVNLIPVVFVVVIGAIYLLQQIIDVPTFVVFYQYSGTFIGYVTAHLALWVAVKNAQGATFRLASILELEDESETREDAIPVGDIEFKNVTFSYGDKKVLDDVSFTISKGQKTALVGYSGSGKSTVLNLIEAFYRPDSGEISLNGVNIHTYDPQNYRSLFTYVPQNAPGFSGSVRELLTYGYTEQMSDEVLRDVLQRADVLETVDLLGGFDYDVGVNASKLSGGQKQKLSIARALLSDTEYMLLDEATSALDVNATMKLQQELDQKTHGKTQILVAHNISTIMNADKILVFSDGRIVAEGTYDVLLKESTLFRELVNSIRGGNENEK